ncbi:MAG: hypothetical protein DRR16_17340 [Candidatus Parabeggiatoa sp. nov. 3]|nr:MAG: hypothetical protein DRR00_16380 [Gammaproteobacteria bacterium]RKZ68667.1 MAG: hypothetical protein DRQ99_03145 [Gammaproteobacteria bacterium]RKZ83426.1 MAG: hypothetical protein DRR16_17340 [Gammaproteobacteria bacterium]
MNKSESVSKIALFVEQDIDKVIIDTLTEKMLSPAVSFNLFCMGMGAAAFYSADMMALKLLEKDYQHFFLLFDINKTEESEVTRIVNILTRPMKESNLLEYVTFCPIVPNINAWLSGYYTLPKKEFGQEFDLPKIKEVVSQIDLNGLKQNNASFNQFAQVLHEWTK